MAFPTDAQPQSNIIQQAATTMGVATAHLLDAADETPDSE